MDYSGALHIGDLTALTQRVVAQADADPTASLVSLDGRIFWVRTTLPNRDQTVDPAPNSVVEGFNTATGRTFEVARGRQVFASLDRSFIYVETDDRDLAEYSPGGAFRGRTLRLPSGWFLANPSLLSDPTPVLANGILVQSAAERTTVDPLTLAIWEPSTGHVRTLGKVWEMVGTYTEPGARSSLVAWIPASCLQTASCPVRITDTANLSSRQVQSPLGYGFDWGGGFSPEGGRLAVFAKSNSGYLNPETQLAIVNVQSGAVQLVAGADIGIGDSVAWAQWFPDGSHLIAGGTGSPFGTTSDDNHYLVDAQNNQVTPFRFLPDRNQDVNYSVVIVS